MLLLPPFLLLPGSQLPASSSSPSSVFNNFHLVVPTLSIRFLLVLAINIAISDNLSYTSKYREISGIVRTVGQIPCAINSSEDVSMILWFKDASGSPIYSYDARNENEPRHLTLKNDWGLRLYFRVWPSSKRSPALMIRELESTDAGYYRCRVDYKNAPTTNSITRLKIIQPPTLLEVQDISQFRLMSDQKMMPAGSGQSINPNLNDITYMGPYLEGQSSITIVCSAYGGKPPPQVLWLWHENGKEMMDSSYELKDGNYVTNELSIVNLTQHTHDLYTCQASNNNETKITHRVNLDIYLTPKHIELDIPDTMIAKASYKLFCHSLGAYPTVKMEFSKVQKRIGAKYQIKADVDNVTTHSIIFTPEIEDDEETLYCRAENPWIVGNHIEARKKLRVYYPPVVVIRFGSSKMTNFTEGESVLLECHVKSNPSLKKMSWYHQGNSLKDDLMNGIIIKGFTLLLRQLKFRFSGDYRCSAENEFGKGYSDHLRIIVNMSPRCADDGQKGKVIPLAIGQSHKIQCSVQAWPPDLSFYWTLEKTKEIVSIPTTGNVHFGNNTKSNISTDFSPLVSTVIPISPVSFGDDVEDSLQNFSSVTLNQSESKVRVDLRLSDPWIKIDSDNLNDSTVIKSSDKTDDEEENEELKLEKDRVKRESIGSFFGIRIPNDFIHENFLPYQVFDEDSYGTVACWAKNSLGQQLRPCYFHIVTPEQADRGQVAAGAPMAEEDEMESDIPSQSTGKRVKNLKTKENEQFPQNQYQHLHHQNQEELDGQEKQEQTYDNHQEKVRGERRNGEKQEEEEVRPLSSKLRGTLGITIILMGVVIFIGCFTGAASWLLLFRRRKKKRDEKKNSELSAPATAASSSFSTSNQTPQSMTTIPPTSLFPPPPPPSLLSPSSDNGDQGISAKLRTGLDPSPQ